MSIAAVTPALPLKHMVDSVVASAKGFGQFLYGDDIRTKRTLAFSYACITFYLITEINSQVIHSCTG